MRRKTKTQMRKMKVRFGYFSFAIVLMGYTDFQIFAFNPQSRNIITLSWFTISGFLNTTSVR